MLNSGAKIKTKLLNNFLVTYCNSFVKKSSSVASGQNSNINVKPFISNRNPRNLEKLTIARKPTGYHLDNPGKHFWYKLQIIKKNRYVVGNVVHNSGKVVITASSSEFGIGKHLYRANDMPSFVTVATILAQRCFETGIYQMIVDEELKKGGEKITAFLDKIQEDGIVLSEPRQYKPLIPWSLEVMEKPWKVHE